MFTDSDNFGVSFPKDLDVKVSRYSIFFLCKMILIYLGKGNLTRSYLLD